MTDDEFDIDLDAGRPRENRRERRRRRGAVPASTPPVAGGRHRTDATGSHPGMPLWVADEPRQEARGGPGTARGTATVPAGPPSAAPRAAAAPTPYPAAAPTPYPVAPAPYGTAPDPYAPTAPATAAAATSGAAAPSGVADYRSRNARSTRGFGAFVRATVRGFGELMITCGLILLLFAAYEIYGKTAIVDAAQSDLDRAFDRGPATASGTTGTGTGSGSGGATSAGRPPPGGAVARLHIPRLAKKWVVVEGVAPDDIKVAPGHYPKSAMPGQVGNFSIAGHRVKSTFWDLDNVVSGDPIVVETRANWYVYRAAASRIVRPSAVEVVDPVPPGFRSGQRLLTITTCNPKWDNYERLVVHAALERTQPRAAGVPRELRR